MKLTREQLEKGNAILCRWHADDMYATEEALNDLTAILAQRQPAQPEAQPDLASIIAAKTKEVESVMPPTEYHTSCKWCAKGYEPIPSSVSDRMVHPDTPVGRIVCTYPAETFTPEAQPAPDVVQKMRQAYSEVDGIHVHGNTLNMTAAAQVLLDEALTEPTDEEILALNDKYGYFQFRDGQGDVSRQFANELFANRRARLAAKPPQQETREQQVTAILQETVKETNEQWIEAAEKVARVREGK
jgi:hypothetical protein